LREIAAGCIFECDVRGSLVNPDLVDADDVGMGQARDGLSLDAEAGQFQEVGFPRCEHHLEGDDAVEAEVAGLVDDAHAATAQLAQQLVTRDFRQPLA
jgi:hypothetical protein